MSLPGQLKEFQIFLQEGCGLEGLGTVRHVVCDITINLITMTIPAPGSAVKLQGPHWDDPTGSEYQFLFARLGFGLFYIFSVCASEVLRN